MRCRVFINGDINMCVFIWWCNLEWSKWMVCNAKFPYSYPPYANCHWRLVAFSPTQVSFVSHCIFRTVYKDSVTCRHVMKDRDDFMSDRFHEVCMTWNMYQNDSPSKLLPGVRFVPHFFHEISGRKHMIWNNQRAINTMIHEYFSTAKG